MAAKTLPSQEYLRQCFDYDPETGSLTWRVRPTEHFATSRAHTVWNLRFAGRSAGCNIRRNMAKVESRIHVCSKIYQTQRVVWALVTGQDPIIEVDHINCNPLDNRLANLRLATRTQNNRNTRGWSKRDLPKGVSKHGRSYRMTIWAGDKHLRVGRFASPAEAHAAYCEIAAELHGNFANYGDVK
jgi:hypothetical protein